ncbi:MAG TPA: hypothetical protein VMT74_06185 [Gaiellaceae bacterium]|nr:hypothetical protein [Gaiellaceae bacterium]
MADDWRIRIEVEEDEHAGGLLHRLGGALSGEASELAKSLESKRLAVSRDENEIFVYASSADDAAKALSVVEAELRSLGIEAKTSKVEHWLAGEERWDDEPATESWEQEELDRGYAPWEVRTELASREEAEALEQQLEGQGYSVIRQSHFLFIGTASKEDADALAARVHGEVVASGETVAEVEPANPFSIFGGLGT